MIYTNQTKLRLRLTTGVDVTGATSLLIKYKKPDGTTASWTATVEVKPLGIFYYDVLAGDIDIAGIWTIWAFVTFSDSTTAAGTKVTLQVSEEGDL